MENTIYAKYSRERRRNFQISTSILEDENKKRSVIKKALQPEASGHVLAMAKNAGNLQKMYTASGLQVCPCKVKDDCSVEFAYINGKNMDQLLTEHIEQGNFEQVREDVQFLWDVLRKAPDIQKFETSEGFQEIFGTPVLPEGMLASPLSNLDMVFSNIIVGGQKVLTDYEWVFDFMIPISFLFARSLFLHGKFQTLPEERKAQLYAIGGVKLEEIPLYHQMEVAFQQYVTGKDELYVLSKMYRELGTHCYFVKDWDPSDAYFYIELVGTTKENPSQQVSLFYQRNVKRDKDIDLKVKVKDSSLYSQFLLKPTDGNAILKFHSITGKRSDGTVEEIKFASHNARLNYGQEYMFQEAPVLVIPNKDYVEIDFSYLIYHQKNYLVKEEIDFRAENADLHEELAKYTGKFHRRVLRKVRNVLSGSTHKN